MTHRVENRHGTSAGTRTLSWGGPASTRYVPNPIMPDRFGGAGNPPRFEPVVSPEVPIRGEEEPEAEKTTSE